MKRVYPDHPVVGVGALILREGKILLEKRRNQPAQGKWSIPGGVVEVGEPLEEAVIRETLEETGLTVEEPRLVDLVYQIDRDAEGKVKYHFVIIDYLAEPVSGEMHHHDDALDARWVHPRDFAKYTMSQTVIDLLKRINLYPEF